MRYASSQFLPQKIELKQSELYKQILKTELKFWKKILKMKI